MPKNFVCAAIIGALKRGLTYATIPHQINVLKNFAHIVGRFKQFGKMEE